MDSAPSSYPPADQDFAQTFAESQIVEDDDASDEDQFDDPELNNIVKKSHQSTSLQQLGVLQKIVFEDATLFKQKPQDLNQLIRAWDILEDRKRILRGKPLPIASKTTSARSISPSLTPSFIPEQLAG